MLNYKILDSGDNEKLEILGKFKIIRPSLSAPFPKKNPKLWNNIDAHYIKTDSGSGYWEYYTKIPESFNLNISENPFISIKIKFTPFGHLGFFPEQELNWKIINLLGKMYNNHSEILNLFAYSGISTLNALESNFNVCHVDASKGMVDWARENSYLSNLHDRKIRWIVDDVLKFLKREINRNRIYDGVILDPPSFGRGAKGEVWKIENDLVTLMEMIEILTKKDPKFIILSCHTTGFSPIILENFLKSYIKKNSGYYFNRELFIKEESGEKLSGGFCAYYFKDENSSIFRLLSE